VISRRELVLGSAAVGVVAPGLAQARSPRKQYLDVHERWTRELRLYNGFFTALIARGTLLSDEMRAWMATERQRMYDLPPENNAAFLADMKDQGAKFHEVFLATDSSFPDAEKFGAQGDDRWNLRFVADGVDQPAVDVSHVRKPTPLQHELFPQLNIWSSLWIARFENKNPAPRSAVLHIGGGYGHGEMDWEAVL
jgi:hypothetical protein